MPFDDFWQAYPRRVAKADARKAWDKLKPSPELEAQILAALEWQRQVWDDPKYTPYPATYLRGERWEDEVPAHVAKPAYSWHEECERLHGSKCPSQWAHGLRMEQAS